MFPDCCEPVTVDDDLAVSAWMGVRLVAGTELPARSCSYAWASSLWW